MEGSIRINFDEMEDTVKQQDNLAKSVLDSNSQMKKDFSSATNMGVLSKNVDVAAEGMQMISEAIANTSKIIKTHTQEFYNYDKELARKAEEMEIPQDFLNENAMEINTYNYSILGKVDGRAVTEGQASKKPEEIDESVVAAQKLVDITGTQSKEEKYDESTIIGKSVLGNIAKDETKKQEYDDTSSIGAQALKDVNKGGVQTQQEYDDSTVIGKSVLGNINDMSTMSTVAAASSADVINTEKKKAEEEELVKLDSDELMSNGSEEK